MFTLACFEPALSMKTKEVLFILLPFFLGSFLAGYLGNGKLTVSSCAAALFVTIGMTIPRYITGEWAKKADLAPSIFLVTFLLAFVTSLVMAFSGRLLHNRFHKKRQGVSPTE